MPEEDGRMHGHPGPSSPGSVYDPSIAGNRMSTAGHETNQGHRTGMTHAGSSHNLHQSGPSSNAGGSSGAGRQVYVVHHDAQTAPVTIYHQEGTQIVELPPRYPAGGSNDVETRSGGTPTDSRSDASRSEVNPSLVLHQARQPGIIMKPQRPPGQPQ